MNAEREKIVKILRDAFPDHPFHSYTREYLADVANAILAASTPERGEEIKQLYRTAWRRGFIEGVSVEGAEWREEWYEADPDRIPIAKMASDMTIDIPAPAFDASGEGIRRPLPAGATRSAAEPKEEGWWWCERCQCRVEPRDATFQETHDGCGASLEWRTNTPTPEMGKEGEGKEVYRKIGSPEIRLMEECGEVIQAISKCLRFGPDNWHPADKDKTPNIELLRRELHDLQRVMGEFGLAGRASRKVLTDEDIRKRSLRIAVDFADLFQKYYPDKPIVEMVELLADEVARAVRDAAGGRAE